MSVLNKSRYKKSLKVFTINGGISTYQGYRTPGNYPRMKTGSRGIKPRLRTPIKM